MYPPHKPMEVGAHFLRERQSLEEHIHKICFAPPYSAPQIYASRALCPRSPWYPGGPKGLARAVRFHQLFKQSLQPLNPSTLSRIFEKTIFLQIALIATERSVGHEHSRSD